jgi:hypothetical protein
MQERVVVVVVVVFVVDDSEYSQNYSGAAFGARSIV